MTLHWDDHDVPSLAGKVALVTGANSGLGLEATKVLARHGARVIMACRNVEKAEAAADEVRAGGADGASVDVVSLDLASLTSVAAAAKQVRDAEPAIDVLINNAGLMAIDQAKTEDGFEMQFGVNHLGHFALTAGLMPVLLATPRSRVVTVSSFGHRPGRLALDDLMFEKRRYDRWRPYFQSKLANLLFTLELQRRLADAGAATMALAAHPGSSHTDLGYEGSGVVNALLRNFARFGTQSARMGALPIVRAAVDPAAKGGQFYGPQFMMLGYPRVETPSRSARDAETARQLWTRSEELTGLRFDISGT